MSDCESDIVHPGGDDVVQAPAVQQRRRHRPVKERLCIMHSGGDGGGSAHALVWGSSHVAAAHEGPHRFQIQTRVERLVVLEPPVVVRGPPTLPGIAASMRRSGRHAAALQIVDISRAVAHVPVVTVERAIVQAILAGATRVLKVESVDGFDHAREQYLVFPVPPRQAFRRAAGMRLADRGGVPDRARKKRRADLSADEVQQRILWTRAGLYVRDQKMLPVSISAVVDARSGQWGALAVEDCPPALQPTGRRVRLKDLVRRDVVARLLQRRESRRPDSFVVRGMRCDGSPKLNTEVLAVAVESITTDDGTEHCCEYLPGGTLLHGLSKLPQKLFQLVWGVWLCFGSAIASGARDLSAGHNRLRGGAQHRKRSGLCRFLLALGKRRGPCIGAGDRLGTTPAAQRDVRSWLAPWLGEHHRAVL